ncbi:CIC11C00000004167 [Sungouiella intermedia]|uniref:CIC11C00000004167 n=1 Tax=Sungouiella intermedia TaxID=45354 RepID=A0A1L0FT04_9ASCO|nr:CIC11C00000004167 [[Candida] intermedia]
MVVNNPNNWHWVDKNCIDWSKAYFNEKLVGISASNADSSVKVASVSSVEGDVEVCQRKGKVISLFDLRLVMAIEGTAGKDFKGSITVPELAYDTEADEIQFDVSIYNEDSETEKGRLLTRKELVPKLRDILLSFGRDLIAINSADIQLESDKVNSVYTKANQEASSSAKSTKSESRAPSAASVSTSASASTKTEAKSESNSSSVPRYNTSTLHLEPTFNTTAEQLYVTLLDSQRIAAWSRSAPQMESFPPKEGSEFKLFGGSISGKFVKLVPNEHITQLWRLEDWKAGHYAELDIQLKQGAGETMMVVKWKGIPIGQEDRVRGNFEDYYVRSIKITFGFGAVL